MKNITVLEKEDLQSIDQKLYYFLQGANGFYTRKGLYHYHMSFNEGDLLKLGEAIENGTIDDFKDLKKHLCDSLNRLRKDLVESRKKTESLINQIADAKGYLELVASKDTFSEALLALV